MTERVIRRDEPEYKKLVAVASALAMLSPNNAVYRVEDVYLDFGQKWMWTTISKKEDWCDVQILCPRDWKLIMEIETADDLAKIVNQIRSNEYFSDK